MDAPIHIRVKPLPIKEQSNPEIKAAWDMQRDSVLAVYYANQHAVIGFKGGKPFVKPKYAHIIEIVDKSTFDPHYNRLPHAWTVSRHEYKFSHGLLRLRVTLKMLQERIGVSKAAITRTWPQKHQDMPENSERGDWQFNFQISVRSELTVKGHPAPVVQVLFDPHINPGPAPLVLMEQQPTKKPPSMLVLYGDPSFLSTAADCIRTEINRIAAAGGFSSDSTDAREQAVVVTKKVSEQFLQFLRKSSEELVPIIATLADRYPAYQTPLSLIYQSLSANRGD